MRLTSRTALDWGLTDFSTLSGQLAPSAVVPLPSQRFVRTLGVETMLDLTHAFSRRPQLPVAAGLQRGGGVGHDAVSALPFQMGPQAAASLGRAADRTNTISPGNQDGRRPDEPVTLHGLAVPGAGGAALGGPGLFLSGSTMRSSWSTMR